MDSSSDMSSPLQPRGRSKRYTQSTLFGAASVATTSISSISVGDATPRRRGRTARVLGDITGSSSLNSASCNVRAGSSSPPRGLVTPDTTPPASKRAKYMIVIPSEGEEHEVDEMHGVKRMNLLPRREEIGKSTIESSTASMVAQVDHRVPARSQPLPRRLFTRELYPSTYRFPLHGDALLTRADITRLDTCDSYISFYTVDHYHVHSPALSSVVPFSVATGNGTIMIGDERGVVHVLPDMPESHDAVRHSISTAMVTMSCHDNAIFDLALPTTADAPVLLATASGDQTARVFDIAAGRCTAILRPCDETSVKQVRFHPSSHHILATSTRGGTISLFDTRMARAQIRAGSNDVERLPTACVLRAQNPEKGRRAKTTHARSVTSIEFAPTGIAAGENVLFAAGEGSASVRMFDLRRLTSSVGVYMPPTSESLTLSILPSGTSFATPSPQGRNHGITSLALNRRTNLLHALSRDGGVYMYSLSHTSSPLAHAPLEILRHPRLRVDSFYVKLATGDDGSVYTGSSDGAVIVFPSGAVGGREGETQGVALVNAHDRNKEVTAVAYSSSTDSVISIADDYTCRRWRRTREGITPLLLQSASSIAAPTSCFTTSAGKDEHHAGETLVSRARRHLLRSGVTGDGYPI
ncbi:WD40-repeat-containing domain protein [Limtongia smithiae]|uniref:WD40-repeat-containing domain protein n=1 Tax=Limtongia smithiae TaxID=1125753 RepID=UPI0034CE5E5F